MAYREGTISKCRHCKVPVKYRYWSGDHYWIDDTYSHNNEFGGWRHCNRGSGITLHEGLPESEVVLETLARYEEAL